jgi:hypothetical protein
MEDLGQALARHAIRDQRQVIVRLETLYGADRHERRVSKVRETMNPLAQGGFEPRNLREVGPEPKQLE